MDRLVEPTVSGTECPTNFNEVIALRKGKAFLGLSVINWVSEFQRRASKDPDFVGTWIDMIVKASEAQGEVPPLEKLMGLFERFLGKGYLGLEMQTHPHKSSDTKSTKVTLTPGQRVPKTLIFPGTPVRRLVAVAPPGYGKSAMLIGIMENFYRCTNHEIVVVCEDKVADSIESELRIIPSIFQEAARNRKGKLRTKVNERGKETRFEWRLGAACRIFHLTYEKLGNELGARNTSRLGERSSDFFDRKGVVLLMDEVHQLANNVEASAGWGASVAHVREALQSYSGEPIIFGMTATPMGRSPMDVIRLQRIFWGRTGHPYLDPDTFVHSCTEEIPSIVVPGIGTERTSDVCSVLESENCETNPCGQSSNPEGGSGENEARKPLKLTVPGHRLVNNAFLGLFFFVSDDAGKIPRVHIERPIDATGLSEAFIEADNEKKDRVSFTWRNRSSFVRVRENSKDPGTRYTYSERSLAGLKERGWPLKIFEDPQFLKDNAPKWAAAIPRIHRRRGKFIVYCDADALGAEYETALYFTVLAGLMAEKEVIRPGYPLGASTEQSVSAFFQAEKAHLRQCHLFMVKSHSSDDELQKSINGREIHAFNLSPPESLSGIVLSRGYYKSITLKSVRLVVYFNPLETGILRQLIGRAVRRQSHAAFIDETTGETVKGLPPEERVVDVVRVRIPPQRQTQPDPRSRSLWTVPCDDLLEALYRAVGGDFDGSSGAGTRGLYQELHAAIRTAAWGCSFFNVFNAGTDPAGRVRCAVGGGHTLLRTATSPQPPKRKDDAVTTYVIQDVGGSPTCVEGYPGTTKVQCLEVLRQRREEQELENAFAKLTLSPKRKGGELEDAFAKLTLSSKL